MPNYVEIVREITNMLKKDREVKWTSKERESFSKIKRVFGESLVLADPDYQKSFLIFSFETPNILVVVLF